MFIPRTGEARTLASTALKVAVVNLGALLLGVIVYLNRLSRDAYASALGFHPSTSYSFLTLTFSMKGKGELLTSPPSLDWIQVVALVAALLDLYYLYGEFRARRRGDWASSSAPPPPSQPSPPRTDAAPRS
jgi:hypothetical protein